MASNYVMIDRRMFTVAMEDLYSAFDALAKTDVYIPGVAGSVGIAIGCLSPFLSDEERKRMRERSLEESFGTD